MQILKANSFNVSSYFSKVKKDNLTTKNDVFIRAIVTVVATITCLGSSDAFPVSALEFVRSAVMFAHMSTVGRLVT